MPEPITTNNSETTFELSVIMPCLDEAETLATCINDALGFFESDKVSGEVVIGDNGSTDGSIEIAKNLNARVVNISKKGYGAACQGAAHAAKGKYIVMGDSDRSYDFSDLSKFLEELRNGAELVMGNRFKGGISPGAMPFKNRYLGNPVLSFIGKILFRTKIGDFHCGIRGFSKKAFEKMGLVSSGMEFASEMVMKATLLGMDVREVPATLSPDGRQRKPHLRPWRDGWRHLRLMLIYNPKYLFMIPGVILMVAGALLMAILVNADIRIGAIGFGPATLVYSAGMISVGLQLVLFALLAQIYGIRKNFLPQDAQYLKIKKLVTADRMILIGLILFIISLFGAFFSLNYWANADFAGLVSRKILSMVVPACTGIVAGMELIFGGLFAGILEENENQ